MWIKLRDGTRLDIKRTGDLEMKRIELEIECNERV
jgi:hypothetical protein